MPAEHFTAIRTWVFDLDNTLYPPGARLFDQVQVKMTAWVMRTLGLERDEADRLRAEYWREHGTTLSGLMHHHGIEPWEFLRDVHDITLDALTPAPALAERIAALPGRRIVYTNGDGEYAARVLAALGLAGAFDAVYGIEHANWRPKPHRDAFDRVFALEGLDPAASAMFEDDSRNLVVPHAVGMRTVHVAPGPDPQAHIHHHTDDLHTFLERLT